jgi:hypothetical protein
VARHRNQVAIDNSEPPSLLRLPQPLGLRVGVTRGAPARQLSVPARAASRARAHLAARKQDVELGRRAHHALGAGGLRRAQRRRFMPYAAHARATRVGVRRA